MSEYQYYEFQAIDRPLTQKEQDELGELSSRAEITSTSFVNEYNYGNFRGDENKVLAKYFDAFLYVANWGTHRVAFRLPRELVDVEAVRPYCDGEFLSLHQHKNVVVVDLSTNLEEGGDWEEGEGYLAPLLPLRSELLAGDLRPLYVGYLAWAEHAWHEEGEEDEPGPPVPPGLGKLTGPQKALAEFLWVDDDLLAAAAEASAPGGPAGPSSEELAAWLAAQPEARKNAWLLDLAEQPEAAVRQAVLGAFRKDWSSSRPAAPAEDAKRRTLRELLGAWEERQEKRKKREAAERARKKEKAEREQARARAARLDTLVGREKALWATVEEAVGSKKPKEYDRAVELLRDLHDLADRDGAGAAFQTRLGKLRARHASKRTFLERLDRAGLV